MTSIKNEQLLRTIVTPHVTEKTMRLSEDNIHDVNKKISEE